MIRIFVMLFLITAVSETTNASDINSLRKRFHEGNASKESLSSVIKMAGISNNPVIMAYKGASMIMMARFEYAPWSKYTSFKNGRILLEKAIAVDPKFVEGRYLRLMIQSNAPSFLGYNRNIKSDLKFLTEQLKDCNIAVDLKKQIIANISMLPKGVSKKQLAELEEIRLNLND